MSDLFTPRQLVALTTFSDLVQEARERVKRDALAAGLPTTASRSQLAAPAPRPMRMQWQCIWRSRWTRLPTTDSRLCTSGISQGARIVSKHFRAPGYSDGLGFCRGEPVQRLVGQLCGIS